MKTKKGVVNQLVPIVTALVGFGVVLVIGVLIMATVKDQVEVTNPCTNSSSYYNSTARQCQVSVSDHTVNSAMSSSLNGTDATLDAMDDIPTWLPIIIITIIGALLIGLVQMFRART